MAMPLLSALLASVAKVALASPLATFGLVVQVAKGTGPRSLLPPSAFIVPAAGTTSGIPIPTAILEGRLSSAVSSNFCSGLDLGEEKKCIPVQVFVPPKLILHSHLEDLEPRLGWVEGVSGIPPFA